MNELAMEKINLPLLVVFYVPSTVFSTLYTLFVYTVISKEFIFVPTKPEEALYMPQKSKHKQKAKGNSCKCPATSSPLGSHMSLYFLPIPLDVNDPLPHFPDWKTEA